MAETSELFKGLKALSAASFPKKCSTCGAVYGSVEDFISKTQSITGRSGLKASFDDDDSPIVELFRNCTCGSTLMDCFNERRDYSSSGSDRRILFDQLLQQICNEGIEESIALNELRKIINGEQSDVLDQLGVKQKIN